MKKAKIQALMIALLLISCQQEAFDTDSIPLEPAVIRFDIQTGASASRLAYKSNGQSGFAPGDEIGIFAVRRKTNETAVPRASDNYMHNVKYTLGNDGSWITADAPIYYPDGNEHVLDFYAYYPYVDGFDPTAAAEGFPKTDLLTGRTIGISKSSEAIALRFDHKTALLRLELVLPGWDALLPRVSEVELHFSSGGIAIPGLNLSAADRGDEVVGTAMSMLSYSSPAPSIPGCYDLFLPAYANDKIERLELTTTAGKVYTCDLSSHEFELESGKVTHLRISTPTDYNNLPNCYVVVPGSVMYIPVWKAFDVWNNNEFLSNANADLTGSSEAELLWMDTKGLIANATALTIMGSGADAVIKTITSENTTGNAVVALKIGGVIRWSWHLWMTEQDITATTYSHNNGQRDYTFMDRNLGATNANASDAGSKGLHYQWGRKDPFVSSSDWTNSNYTQMYDANGDEITGNSASPTDAVFGKGLFLKEVTGSNAPIADAMTQPQVMYVISDSPWGDKTDDLWGANGDKSPFDPCPGGWRVPDYANGVSPWKEITQSALGHYPAGGYRNFSSASLSIMGSDGYYWSAAAIGINGCNLKFSKESINPDDDQRQGNGYAVRCVMDSQPAASQTYLPKR